MNIDEIIKVDKDILGGRVVFTDTRVPVETLFDHLGAGVSIDDFLEDFPTVSRNQAIDLLDTANKLFTIKNVGQLYETFA